MTFNRIGVLAWGLLFALGALPAGAGERGGAGTPAAQRSWTGKPGAAWKDYDRLVGEQKLEQAAALADEVLQKARSARDGEEWARGLIRTVQLRTALHGYETSVRFLKDQPWPEDLLGRTAVELFYAHSLVTYARAYSWEIRQRERVEARGPVDLKAWSIDRIYAEATGAALAAWERRESLGELPNAALAEYVAPNTYPAGVRPTLRDAVTYLFVELLADTSGWSPEKSNQLHRLDLGALLAGRGARLPAPNDPRSHPLEKIAGLLGDLERWHAGRGAREAALEARIERLRRLAASFTGSADRAAILADLEERLPAFRSLPWWSVGTALRAELIRDETAADNLVRARRVALEGRDAHPGTVGALRCASIISSIEAPEFQLEGMGTDAPGKRSLGVSYRNLGRIWLRAYPYDVQRRIERADDYNLFPQGRELQEILGRKPAHRWSEELAATPDFKSHRAFTIPPVAVPGFYVVLASAREDFAESENAVQAVFLSVGDLALLTRQEGGDVVVTALSGASGRPAAGASIRLYRYDWKGGHRSVAAKMTGSDGMARFRRPGDSNAHFLLARKDGDLALDPTYLHLYRQPDPREARAALVYTDRSIYRPGQKVLWMVVAYRGRADRGELKTDARASLSVSLLDANGQTVETRTVAANDHGSASGEFAIPAGRLLGQWSIRTSPQGAGSIRVEEYKRPTFEAKFLEAESPLRLNKPARLVGEAKYYFGLPVTAGSVAWRVTREPVYPWWWGLWWGAPTPATGAQTIAAGKLRLDADGRFAAAFTPEADERLADSSREVSYRYRIVAEITDEGGETRTAERTFRLGFVAVEAAVRQDAGFYQERSGGGLIIRRTDLDGMPTPGEGSWRILKLSGPAAALLPADQPLPPAADAKTHHTPGDLQRPRWDHRYSPTEVLRLWQDGGQVASGRATHGAGGEARLELPALPAGAYRLRYATRDPFGATYEMSHEFLVAGARPGIPLPAVLLVEQPTVRVGGKTRLLAFSGLAGQPLIFERFRAGRSVERRVLESGRDDAVLEIPVTEEDRGGFGISLTAVRDHQVMSFTSSILVPWDDKELSVAFSSFRDRLRPGQRETWTVKVTGPAGADTAIVGAEVLAYMYDRSLDAFVPHAAPSPLGLYPHRGWAPQFRASLGPAHRQGLWANLPGGSSYPGLSPDTLRFPSGYGIGGPGRRGGFGYAQSVAMPASAPAMKKAEVSAGRQELEAAAESSFRDQRADEPAASADKGDAAAQQQPVQMRSDFSETAFWKPHLLTGADGSVSFEFAVPDSVTSWNLHAHAITRDLKSGSALREARSVKELMVRPYLPRFLREGDRAELKVAVNNASERDLAGILDFDILDPGTNESLLASFGLARAQATARFVAKAGRSADLSFPVVAPARVGTVAFRVSARSGDHSDGELRPIPVLPGRMHLAQSRFAVVKDAGRRELRFEDLARDDDPTRIQERLVVTLDAQLFYSVLSALPYLVNYPYECTEQTLNRFLSTGILTSLYGQYPQVKRMAAEFSERRTRLETWDAPDPNRAMALEETPWLVAAKGGGEDPDELWNVLDPKVAAAQREAALAKLRKLQTSSGGFPWFPGGPPSPYMTLYVLYGFSKGREFGVDVPRDTVERAFSYLHRHFLDEIAKEMQAADCCWEFVTFLNYVLGNFPDLSWNGGVFTAQDRREMLDFSFRHWKRHSPYLKGYLALTLKRMGRPADARLVWQSVMDSAKTAEDQGTYWAPEDRSWLWYNDTIETHAFAVRTVMELDPEDPKLDGLVLWLLLNKKLNHWKSTRATAEVIYSLAHYLKATGQLGLREEATVAVGGRRTTFTFEPDHYTGKKNQIVVPGEKIDPATTSTVVVEKQTRGYLFASATWQFSTERLPEAESGDFLRVSRSYYRRVGKGDGFTLEPLAEGAKIRVGDQVEVHLSLKAKHPAEYVHLRDPRAAGFEPESALSRYTWDLGIGWYEEIRDSGTSFFFDALPQGEHTFKYRVRAATAGTFKVAPATLQPLYAPEFAAYSAGAVIGVGAP